MEHLKTAGRRVLTLALVGSAFLLAACGETPETTEEARGVLGGINVVLGLSVAFVVVAGGIIVLALGYSRAAESRRALEEAEGEPEVEEEPEETEVAGIGIGSAGVPRWLYFAYVVIPVFAFAYVLANVQVAEAPEESPAATAEPGDDAVSREVTIVAENIEWDLEEITFPGTTEVTVTMDNQDAGIPHNWTLWPSEEAASAGNTGEVIAETDTVNGVAQASVSFDSDGVGEYYYNCTIHPNMQGTLIVQEAPEGAGEAPEGGPAGEVAITAENIEFNKDELALDSGDQVAIEFTNDDAGIPHNVAIYESDAMQEPIFQGEIFNGADTRTYTFEAPPPGEYYFVCDVHPNMNGTITFR